MRLLKYYHMHSRAEGVTQTVHTAQHGPVSKQYFPGTRLLAQSRVFYPSLSPSITHHGQWHGDASDQRRSAPKRQRMGAQGTGEDWIRTWGNEALMGGPRGS